MAKKNDETPRCSFCGKSGDDAIKLIAGLDKKTFICETCVFACSLTISSLTDSDEAAAEIAETASDNESVLSPDEIKSKLDDYIIGQDKAKRTLAVAVYNHYKRIRNKNAVDDVELEKSNILMLGPTGSGKTLLAKTLAKVLNVPIAICDATTLTEAGYVGEDVENILLKLIQNANDDISKAEKGIIYIDEIDKIARKGENMSITRDVSGEGVQQALLKIMESTIASVPPQGGRKHPYQECMQIDTTNILFIMGGAFVSLEKIIRNRLSVNELGFGGKVSITNASSYSELIAELRPDDLITYGLIPEFVGRAPVVVGLDALDSKALVSILTEPKNALIKQYQKMLELDHVKLTFTDEAISAIAGKAIALNTGARGLRSIMEGIMLDTMYEIPTRDDISEVIVDKDCVVDKKAPQYVLKK